MDVVVVTGCSGAGKSTTINALEDAGYYCIDNLPTALVPRFIELCVETGVGMSKVALGIDLRDHAYVERWAQIRAQVEAGGHHVVVLFLDANDSVLIRRYSETRRVHPLGTGRDLPEAIAEERRLLEPVKRAADLVIDTSDLNVHDLRRRTRSVVRADEGVPKGPRITIRSFGFKYGITADADLVLDVRFLPNPYFVESLKGLSGLDRPVVEFVMVRPVTSEFLGRVSELLDFLLPWYHEEGKAYLTLGLGCTGGRHRSVVLAEELARRLREKGLTVNVRHRDIDRAGP